CFEDIIDNRYIEIKETKTRKKRVVVLNSNVQKSLKELKMYYKSTGYLSTEGYIFKSLSRYNKKYLIESPLTNNGVSKEFNKIKDMLNISYPIGSHSLRKTWGYTAYKKTKDIAIIMKVLNHSSIEQTLKYIGIEEEEINNLYDEIII
ncbi:MAG: tyrosine-type recombinase/integrase, partial [Peptostreptococcaceae bacterium]